MYSSNNLSNPMDEILILQKQEVMALMSCIHISNISSELRQDDIREEFSSFGVIESIHMACDSISKKHAGFAFVEYDIPEAAHLAKEQMNGVSFGGKNLKVVCLHVGNDDQNDATNTMPKTESIIKEIIQSAKQYNRIYVASLNPLLIEEDVKFLFEKFGRIKSCELPSIFNRRKGYGFIEFETEEAIKKALSMNLTLYAGRNLRICRTITPPNSSFASAILPNDAYRKDEDVDIEKQTKSAIRAYNDYVNFFA